jgi:hypothetical protein
MGMAHRTMLSAYRTWWSFCRQQENRQRNKLYEESLEGQAQRQLAEKRNRVELLAARIGRRNMSKAFNGWYDAISRKRIGKRVVQHMQHRRLSAAFRGWWHAAERRARVRHLMQRAMHRWSFREQSESFQTWRLQCMVSLTEYERTNKLHRRARLHRIGAIIIHRTMARALTSLKLYTQEEVRLRRLTKRVVLKMSKRTLSTSFEAWFCFVEDRSKCRKILIRMSQRRERETRRMRQMSGWRRWTSSTEFSKLMDSDLATQEALDQYVAEKKAREDSILHRFLTRMKNHVISIGLTTWRNFIHDSKVREHQLRHAQRHWTQSLLSRAWKRWDLSVVEVLRHRSLLQKSTVKMQHAVINRAWMTWIDYVLKRIRCCHLIKAMLSRWSMELLRKGLRSWIVYVRDMNHRSLLEDRVAKLEMHRKMVVEAAVLDRTKTQEHTKRVLLRSIIRQLGMRMTRLSWQHWRTVSERHRKQEGRKMLETKESFLLDMSTQKDKATIEHGKEVKDMTSTHRRTLAMRTITLARNSRIARKFRLSRIYFTEWRRAVWKDIREKVLVKMLLEKNKLKLQKETDAITVEERRRKAIAIRTNIAVRRMKAKTLHNAWSSWLDMIVQKNTRKVIYQRAKIKITRKLETSAFSTWWNAVLQGRRIRRLLSRIKHRIEASAFDMWRHETEQNIRNRGIAERCRARLSRNLEISAFTSWWECVESTRASNARAKQLLSRIACRTQSLAFDAWCESLDNEKHKRTVLKRARVKLTKKLEVSAFSTWWNAVLQGRRIRRLLSRIKHRIEASAFDMWIIYVAKRTRCRHLMKAMVSRWTMELLRKGMRSWMVFIHDATVDDAHDEHYRATKSALNDVMNDHRRTLAIRTLGMAKHFYQKKKFSRLRQHFIYWRYNIVKKKLLQMSVLSQEKLSKYQIELEMSEEEINNHKEMVSNLQNDVITRQTSIDDLLCSLERSKEQLVEVQDDYVTQNRHYLATQTDFDEATLKIDLLVSEMNNEKKLHSQCQQELQRLIDVEKELLQFKATVQNEKEQLKSNIKTLKIERRDSFDTFQTQLANVELSKKELHGDHRRSFAMRTIAMAKNFQKKRNLHQLKRHFIHWRYYIITNQRIMEQQQHEVTKQDVVRNTLELQNQQERVMALAQSLKQNEQQSTQQLELQEKKYQKEQQEIKKQQNRILAMRTIKMAGHSKNHRKQHLLRKCFHVLKLKWKVITVERALAASLGKEHQERLAQSLKQNEQQSTQQLELQEKKYQKEQQEIQEQNLIQLLNVSNEVGAEFYIKEQILREQLAKEAQADQEQIKNSLSDKYQQESQKQDEQYQEEKMLLQQEQQEKLEEKEKEHSRTLAVRTIKMAQHIARRKKRYQCFQTLHCWLVHILHQKKTTIVSER